MSEQEQAQEQGTPIPGEENLSAQGATLSTQEKAEAVGWHEKDGGLSAEEFLAKRDDHLGLMRGDLKKLEDKLAESNATMTAMAEHLQKSNAEAQRRGYDKAIADAKEQMQRAVEESDGEAFTQASKRAEQLEEQKQKISEETIISKPEAVNPLQAALKEHQNAHPELFDTAAKAEAWQKELRYQGERGLGFEDAVAAADKAVRQSHLPARNHLGPVGGETVTGVVSEFSQLPAEAKAAYERFNRANPNFTKDEYLKSYNEA
jgi:hypothetical protein